ncbi:type II toxin-antitoxin system HipA family toxin [Schaalia sp. Marseille-Q2122]|uniref:type II toxin-antitoxin system HipA family toxin n=1 Tax=Schaalia sp. Marseille-Q2122 TaxID=2736604 RepID=UPI0020CA3C7D|nr:HipA domain-containing protein [Schaalia sp. Marseille-Q2122]
MTLAPTADVYKAGHLAAHITLTSTGETILGYISGYDGPPLATTLPVTDTDILTPNGALPAFFTGLLPEGARLERLKQCSKQSLSNELRLLLEVGADVLGDVQVVPHGALPQDVEALVHESLTEMVFADLLTQVDRRALPGVQEKASAAMISIPTRVRKENTTRTPQCPREGIIKLDPPRYLALTANEFQHLQAARKLGIPVAQAELVQDSRGESALFVERFDRVCVEGQIVRIACEDAAQVMGVTPAMKYEVASEDVVEALSELCAGQAAARRNLYLQFLYAWLTGNGDVHAKNLSILRGPTGWEIAPMYDLPCTLVYGDDEMALSLQGRKKKLTLDHWRGFADALGLPEKSLPRIFTRALRATSLVDWERLPFTGSVLHGVQRELASRRWQCERFLDQ